MLGKKTSLYTFFLLLNSISWNTDKSIPFQNVFYNSEQLYVHSSFIWPGNTTDRGCGWWRMLPFNALICLSYFNFFAVGCSEQLAEKYSCSLNKIYKISGCNGWVIIRNNQESRSHYFLRFLFWFFVVLLVCFLLFLGEVVCNTLILSNIIDWLTSAFKTLTLYPPWRHFWGVLLFSEWLPQPWVVLIC